MKKAAIATSLALAIVLSFSFAAVAPAQAQQLNLESLKCGEWLKAPKDTITVTLAWIDGYYKDEDADPVIDFDKLLKNSEKLAEACAKAPDRTLGDVAEELFG